MVESDQTKTSDALKFCVFNETLEAESQNRALWLRALFVKKGQKSWRGRKGAEKKPSTHEW